MRSILPKAPTVAGLLALFSIANLYSATFYISTTGNDSNAGTPNAPWATTAHAFAVMMGGDTLIVKNGIYTGQRISNPPSGSPSAYTVIRAEQDGGATFTSTTAQLMLQLQRNYVLIQGFKFEENAVDSTYVVAYIYAGQHHNKIINCGFVKNPTTTNNNVANFIVSGSSNLIEGCYAWGGGRYKYIVYGGDNENNDSSGSYNIFRRCVARHDREYSGGFNPQAAFCNYQGYNNLFQNCIVLDSNFPPTPLNKGYADAPYYDSWNGPWFLEKGQKNGFVKLEGCIALGYSGTFVTDNPGVYPTGPLTFENCVGINGYSGIVIVNNRPITINHSIVSRLSGEQVGDYRRNEFGVAGAGSMTSVTNSLFFGNLATAFGGGGGIISCAGSTDYNAFFSNTYNMVSSTSGPHVVTNVNPLASSLLYPVRIETGSPLDGAGGGGTDIGPMLLKQVGVPGTLYGEPGYDTITDIDLWPWPNEARIKADMSAYPSNWPAGNLPSPTRGFCGGTSLDGTPQTLTKYVWEWLGNRIPLEVYGGVDTSSPTVSNVAITASSTSVTITWTTNESATSSIDYGLTSAYGANISSASLVINHRLVLTGLSVGTLYHFRITAADSAGNTATDIDRQFATTDHTFYVATTGSDTTGDGSASNPWATIQHAVDQVQAGDTVLVANGTYAGFHSVRSGAPGSPIIVRANGSSVAINSRNANTIDNINIENTDYVTIEGFRSVNSQRAGIRVAVSRGVTVRNNTCANAATWGIFTAFAPEVYIDSNTCYAAGQHGIYVSNSDVSNDNPVVRGNTSFGNTQNGIQLNGDLTSGGDGNIEGALVENNTVYGNGYKGFSLISITSATVRNNLVYNNGVSAGAGGIHLAQEPGTNVLPLYNIVVNNTVVEPRIAAIRITDGTTNTLFNNICVSAAPIANDAGGNYIDTTSNIQQATTAGLFTDAGAGNYTLTATSPARNAGKAAFNGVAAPTTDFTGNTRPSGAIYDSGAYEYIEPTSYYIRGYVRDRGGVGISSVTVTLSGNATGTVLTANDGSYQFSGLVGEGAYTLTPSKGRFSFAPVSLSTASLGGNWDNADFTGTPLYTISGYVLNAGGGGIGNVTVTLTGNLKGSTLTAADGTFQFSGLPDGAFYMLTPSATGFAFVPASISTNSLSSDWSEVKFTGTLLHNIRGYVRDSGGVGISSVTVALLGNSGDITFTAGDGSYQFLNLSGGKAYTLVPTKSGLTFSPASISTASLNSDWDNADFTGVGQYHIQGYVRDSGGVGISSVTVALSGSTTGAMLTAGNGLYQFAGLAGGGTYTLAPSKAGYSFTPVSVSTSALLDNWDNADFTGTPLFQISGYVRDSGGAGIGGVAVTLSGSATGFMTTGGDGSFRFLDLPDNGGYAVTPAKAGYSFVPASVSTASLKADWDNADFIGTALYYIRGYVRDSGGAGISNVTVSLSGYTTGAMLTAGDGMYQFLDLAGGGTYTLAPSKTGFTFAPAAISTASLSSNWDNADFTGTALFFIRGYVRDSGGTGISNVTVSLSGNTTGTMLTAGDGSYQFPGLPGGNAYTLTPAKTGFSFAPASLSTASLSNDWDNADFAGTPLYYIRGYVRGSGGGGISNVAVSLSGNTTGVVLTGDDGSYQFLDLAGGNAYTLTPTKTGFVFTPAALSTATLSAGWDNADFTGTPLFTVRGYVRDTGGSGISGVTVALSGSGSGSVTTGGDGTFQFPDIAGGGSYTVTPSKAGLVFSPVSLSTAALSADWDNVNFTGAPPAYSIRGYVRNAGGTGIGAVTMTLSGGASQSTQTSGDGSYQFLDLPSGGAYAVTPTKTGFGFVPVSLSTASLDADWDNVSFTGTAFYRISGYVRDTGGSGMSGVTVTLTGGALGSVTTGADGAYLFPDLQENGAYTVTPQKAGWTFVPVSISTASLNANLDNGDFTGSLITYYIKGHVRDAGGTGISSATVTLSGDLSRAMVTGNDGYYEFLSLAANGAYTVMSQKAGWTFRPPSISTGALGMDWDNRDFTGVPLYTVGGYVLDANGTGINNVVVTLSGSAAGTVVTKKDGAYQFTSLPADGTYTITPSRKNYAFSPPSRTYPGLSGNLTGQNFTGGRVGPFAIRGYVRDTGGAGMSGIKVSLSGEVAETVTTGVDGSYQFLNLPENAAYAVTPKKAGLAFRPPLVSTGALSADWDNQDFTAVPLYSVRGFVLDTAGAGINNVTLTLSGSVAATFVTKKDGSYKFTGMPADGTYVITPKKNRLLFSPPLLSYSGLSGDLTAQNFTGGRAGQFLGTVWASNGIGIGQAVVTLSGPEPRTVTTDEFGRYGFLDVTAEGTYSISVAKEGYQFKPLVRDTSVLDEVYDWDFAAVELIPAGSGDIRIVGSTAGRGTVDPDRGETARIYFKGSEAGQFELKIFTLGGKLVWQDAKDGAGEGMFEWAPKNTASGTYVAHVSGPGINTSKKLIILK